jgi:hypothetical protein
LIFVYSMRQSLLSFRFFFTIHCSDSPFPFVCS